MRWAWIGGLLAVSRIAAADVHSPATNDDIVVDIPGDRSTANQVVLGGLAAIGVTTCAFGVYWAFDSHSLTDELAMNRSTGLPFSARDRDLTDRRDRAERNYESAFVAGGAVLVGAAIAFIVTEPRSTRTVIHPHTTQVTPLPGGAMVGETWRF